jgi:hypothetical protein
MTVQASALANALNAPPGTSPLPAALKKLRLAALLASHPDKQKSHTGSERLSQASAVARTAAINEAWSRYTAAQARKAATTRA